MSTALDELAAEVAAARWHDEHRDAVLDALAGNRP